jgi:hypothetical protein
MTSQVTAVDDQFGTHNRGLRLLAAPLTAPQDARSARQQTTREMPVHTRRGMRRQTARAGSISRRRLSAAQLIPSQVPLTDPPGDRLAEIASLADPRQ